MVRRGASRIPHSETPWVVTSLVHGPGGTLGRVHELPVHPVIVTVELAEPQAAGQRRRDVQARSVVKPAGGTAVAGAEDVPVVVVDSGARVLDLAIAGPPVPRQLHPAVLHVAERRVVCVPGVAAVVRPRDEPGPLGEGGRVVHVVEGQVQVEGVLPRGHPGREEAVGRHPSLGLASCRRSRPRRSHRSGASSERHRWRSPGCRSGECGSKISPTQKVVATIPVCSG